MLNSVAVSKLCEITLRRLQLLDEKGHIKPIIRNHARRYDDEQIAQIQALVELQRRGVGFQRAIEMAKTIPPLRVRKVLQAIDLLSSYGLVSR